MKQLFRDFGYEVFRRDGELRLYDRRTAGLVYARGLLTAFALVLGGLGLLGGLNLVENVRAPYALLGVAAALVPVIVVVQRVYVARRDLSLQDVRRGWIIDRRERVLRDLAGNVLSDLAGLRVEVRTDWWRSRGIAQFIRLRWVDGRCVVFRTIDRSRARDVRETLDDAIGGRGVS